MEATKFFAYGSLAQGNIHFSKFFQNASVAKNVFARGSVYRLEVGFPVFHLEGHQMVPGDLITIEASDILLSLLDEFHGYSRKTPEKSLYLRHEIDVFLDNGVTTRAFVYAINPIKMTRSCKLIENGNWVENLVQEPPCTVVLTEREREYIRKLGQSSGREIVPIQLDLYRGLMNRGMIVDKGRRLALTKFGKEVFRFLD